jgi:creatinine amidohydrolase
VPSRVAAPRNTSRPSRGAALRNSEKPEFITTAAFLSDHPQKTKNYLPDVSRPEVEALLTRTDMAALPLTALEQHGHQLPTGTDFFIGVEEAKLIAQKTDVLVAPILLPGISPYHVEFPGTIALSPDTFQRVYFEAAQSLIKARFPALSSNQSPRRQSVGLAIHHRSDQSRNTGCRSRTGRCRGPFLPKSSTKETKFDRHAGVGETSSGLYLFPTLVDMSNAGPNSLQLPEH